MKSGAWCPVALVAVIAAAGFALRPSAQTIAVDSGQGFSVVVQDGPFTQGAPAQGGRGRGGGPARDQPPPTGSSRLSGRLVDAATGTPLRRANVRAFASEIRVQRATATDAEGRYEFADLPAGRYTVSASKAGYVDGSYGQTRVREPGKPVQLGDRQAIDRVDIALSRGGVITGRVLDEFGEPIPDVMVAPVRLTYTPAGRRAMPSGRAASTNDIGEFRLFGLAPGAYYISATSRTQNFALPMVINGSPTLARDDNRSGYAPTYYPSATSIDGAQPLTIGAGETLPEVTISLMPTRVANVSGFVYDEQGQPSGGGVTAMPLDDTTMVAMMGGNGGPIRPDGSFVITGLAPGRYMLRANIGPRGGRGGRGGRGFNGPPEMAVATIVVNGEDVSGVRLQPLRAITLEGMLVVDPAAAGALNLRNVRIAATPTVPGSPLSMIASGPPPTVNEDYTFELPVYQDTAITIRANGLPQGWMVRAVRQNGADVTDGFTLTSQSGGRLEVDLSDRAPSVSGQVTDGQGAPATTYAAIAFPQDSSLWTAMPPGRSGFTRADEQGRFAFRNLRPGQYYIVAAEHIDTNEYLDPQYLERASREASRVDLLEGDTKTIDLKLADLR
jgi:protocatechuate 3,4-dioxygenase beta subunit